MRDDTTADAHNRSDLMQCHTQLVAEPGAPARASQEKAISGVCFLRPHLKTMHDPIDEGVDGNETLRPQLAKGHMNGPLILTDTAQTIERQIEALTDPHTGVPEQQQGVADPIAAPQQFILDQVILLGCERTGQTLVGTRDVVSTDEAG
jgi:hypothetical protein